MSLAPDATPAGPARVDPRLVRSRARVLAATARLLATAGISGVTIEAVSALSGVAKTTIYRQWDDAPTLVLATLDDLLQPPVDPDLGTLRADLLHLVGGLARALIASPAAGIMAGLMDAAERDPAFAALHAREAERRHGVVLAVIERGVRRGELPAGTDPHDVLDLLTGPIVYRRYTGRRSLDAAFAARVVDRVLAAYDAPTLPAEPGA